MVISRIVCAGYAPVTSWQCLDYIVAFGEKHMDHLVLEMLAYHHGERPHQAKGNDPLAVSDGKLKKPKRKKGDSPPEVVPFSQIACRERLGGLLKHYYRRAA